MAGKPTLITDINGITREVSAKPRPADRKFRGAWVHTPDAVVVDMLHARALYRSKLNTAVKAAKQDLARRAAMAWLEDDATAKAALNSERSALDAMVADASIDTAPTPETLLAKWDEVKLGRKWEEV